MNPYSFNNFLQARDSYNDFHDNAFLQHVARFYLKDEWETTSEKLRAFSLKSSNKWRKTAELIAQRENHPRLRHYNAYNQRIDEIVRPGEAIAMEHDIFSEGLFSEQLSDWEKMLKRFLLHHNGEASIMCPLACTDGLVDLLKTFESELSLELKQILLHCTEGYDDDFGIGAQFMTEIQGGSNIPANVLQAIPEEDYYRLYGTKFFCSAIHADYAVVTAKVEDSGHIATFIVPSWSNKRQQIRNGFVINRLKWKLGTSELPSAEVTYEGAKAYPVGPLEKGVAIAVGIVLTKSRLDIGMASSAFMLRAVREALQYSQFRTVFGKQIEEYPLAYGQLQEMEQTTKRTTAALFKICAAYFKQQAFTGTIQTTEEKRLQFQLRELILFQKLKASKDTVETLRTAISIFGGNGAIEDFSSIPRLFRDAMVNELWEGPRNVLLTQIHRDMKRAATWYAPGEFIKDILTGCEEQQIAAYAEQLEKLLTYDLSAKPNKESIRFAKEWERFCDDLFLLYQEQALLEVGDAPIIQKNTFK